MASQGVIVYRSYDALGVDLAEAQLAAAGIPHVRLGRGHAALVGVGENVIEQRIEVPATHAATARALLSLPALRLVDGGLDDHEPDDELDDDDHRTRPQVSGKQRLLALGLSLIWPGMGIAYTGSLLVGSALALWVFLALPLTPPGVGSAAAALFAQVLPRLLDLVAAQRMLTLRGRAGASARDQALAAFLLIGALHLGARFAGPPLSEWLSQHAAEDTAATD